MPLFPIKPVRVEPFFGFRSQNRLVLNARALRSGMPQFEPRERLGAMRIMLSQLVSHETSGLPVELSLRTPSGAMQRHAAVTNAEGYVHFDVELASGWSLPEHAAWERGNWPGAIAMAPKRCKPASLCPAG